MPAIDATDVLLVGGGVASVRCARALRAAGFDGRILLVGDEPTPPYNRPPLSKELLRDNLPDELLLAEPERWFSRRDVELRTDRQVVALDPQAKIAELGDGTRIRFRQCLLATGAEPRKLPVPGGDGALLLRTVSDARRLRSAAAQAGPGASVVIVGGGLIGLEVASSLAASGLRPTVVERTEQLWAGTLGSRLSGWALGRLTAVGVEVLLATGVDRIAPDGVRIGDRRIAAAFVVAGVGVRPRDGLAAAAGLAVDDGVVTDAAHRTSHPAVWAAGDVARRNGRRVEHWHAAREGGERAARSMLGLELGADLAPWLFTEVAGHTVDVVGAADGWQDERWVVPHRLLVRLEDDRVVQAASIDGAAPVEGLRELLAAGASPERIALLARGVA